MSVAFGLTQDGQGVEWFDTMDEAINAHRGKSARWEWVICIYGFAHRIGTMCYNPTFGFFLTAFVVDGENLVLKYGLNKAIYGVEAP